MIIKTETLFKRTTYYIVEQYFADYESLTSTVLNFSTKYGGNSD